MENCTTTFDYSIKYSEKTFTHINMFSYSYSNK